ncbi:MAG: glycoside hydrolase family 130 protein [bacterium]
MKIFSFFGNSNENTSYKDERNIYIGNINLDRLPGIEYEDIPGIFKRILHKRIDRLHPDNKKVITRFLKINDRVTMENIVKRAIELDEKTAALKLKEIMREFSKRHKSIEEIFMRHFVRIEEKLKPEHRSLSKEKKLLIGSLFTLEYSNESVSLFNPSVVLYPKQNDLKKGQIRVIFSFRATGEGHISSIVFRSAIIEKNNDIYLEPISRYASTPQINLDPTYDKDHFKAKLKDINALDDIAASIMKDLPDKFTYNKLKEEIGKMTASLSTQGKASLSFSIEEIKWLARSNYEVVFPPEHLISERVIFPASPTESNGIEDARFVRFREDDGSHTYFATYTAYNGSVIMPQLLRTKDFHHFKMNTLNGPLAKDKGMALFPRKVNGKFAMLSRVDNENIYLMYSDNIYFWDEAKKIIEPREPWEFIKIGNCGSPIETKEGWIVLTHGVGPMRKYCIGVVLLDLNDPSKVIARLKQPLISPSEEEREGYVPNVVYSCGSILLNDKLIIPYASSDSVSSIAVISLDELLRKLLSEK